MITWIARELGVAPQAFAQQLGPARSTPFTALGLDSVLAIQFVGALEEKLGRAIPASTLWDHDNVPALARFLTTGQKA
ncbi:MAG: acyl carrier protein [Myxococcales bacterium]|nr:acyl carrier protein [Myxococcales bacterium]